MSKLTRREFVAGASALACAAQTQPSNNNALLLWFKQPTEKWTDALPIGNGRLGAMVFGGAKEERLQLNEDTLWSGAPRQWNNPGALPHLAEVRRLVLDQQDYVGADRVCRQMQGLFNESYQPLADLHLTMDHGPGVTDYRRELDLDTAVARTSYRIEDAQYVREAFASAVDQVIVLRITTTAPTGMSLTLSLDSPVHSSSEASEGGILRLTGKAPSHVEHSPARPEDAVHYDPAEGQGMRFEAFARVLAEGGKVRPVDQRLRVEGAKAVTVLLAASTGYLGYDRDPDLSAEAIAAACRRWPDALLHGPQALVLDEPTTSLDLHAAHELRQILRKLAGRGISIVMVTHHLPDIIPEMRRVVLMRDGRVVGDGPKEQVLEAAPLSAVFGLPVEVLERGGYYHVL